MSDKKPNLRERALFLLSPNRANKAYQKRTNKALGMSGAKMIAGGGYGNHGASATLNSMIGWIVRGGSPEEDIDLHGATLRRRSRDLFAGGGLARSGPKTLTTSVVGWGIQPKPKIDGEKLGMTDDQCSEWERNTLREFRLWAESPMCDAGRQQNFYAQQQLAFLSELVSGDCFVLFGMKENKRTPYQTTIRLLEADRISTPGTDGMESVGRDTESGGRIIDGVETDNEGVVISYHVASRYPNADIGGEIKWVEIEAFGEETGFPNILHIMTRERPEQRRGIPFVSAQIEQIKQLDRYINSELAANVVSAMLTAFLESDEDDGKSGIEDAVNEEEKVTHDEFKAEFAPGAIWELPPGKRLKEVNPLRNNSAFEAFVSTLETIIGASMEIPKEVLIKKYESNYTAARSALMDFWRTVRVHRAQFNATFNQPIYEQWLSEAVALGRIDAPGFFDDPAIRQAWCGCMWMGVSMGHVDPLKEVKAAETRIANNISTQEQEASEYNGNDWLNNIRQRKKEIAALNTYEQEQANGTGQETQRHDGGKRDDNT